MREPLFWNPLPDAAAWLQERTGRPMDARSLVDFVAKQPGGEPDLTIVRTVLPLGMRFALLRKEPNPPDAGKHDLLTREFGLLPAVADGPYIAGLTTFKRLAYIDKFAPDHVDPLSRRTLVSLLLHGDLEFAALNQTKSPDDDTAYAMPYGTTFTVSLKTCGMNRADLLALGEQMAADEASPVRALLVHDATEPATSDTGTGWQVFKPASYPGYTKPLYDFLKAEHTAGQRKPTARDVLDKWKKSPPADVYDVSDSGLKFYDSKGNTKAADLEGIRKRIGRMTIKRPLSGR